MPDHTLSALSKVADGDVFVGNILHDVPFGAAGIDWDSSNEFAPDGDGNRVTVGAEMTDLLVERRRWTTRDWAHLHTADLAT